MSEFDKYAHAGKCDVCGKETKVVVCASTIGPLSLAYCENCHANTAEPYNLMVSYIACAGEWPKDISPEGQARVRRLLTFHGKTEAEFAEDVAELQRANMI